MNKDNYKYEYAICYSLKMIPNKHRYLDHYSGILDWHFVVPGVHNDKDDDVIADDEVEVDGDSVPDDQEARVRNWWTGPKHCNSPTHAQCTAIPSLCNLLQIALFSSACTIRHIHKKWL